MGDLIEFSTPQKHQNLFYKVTSNALMFHVKGEANATVGLAQTPTPDECIYSIVIGCGNKCLIINRGRRYEKIVSEKNILSTYEYIKFWISWNDGYIKIGHGSDSTPLFSIENLERDLNFVTFSTLNNTNDMYWKCHLPPPNINIKPAVKKVKDGRPRWVQFDEKVPEDSVIGGFENEVLYIMRAMHETALTPGKFVPSTGKGFVAWGVSAHEKTDCEILCGFDCIWIRSSNDKIPFGAIEAGYSEIVHERLYIGRVKHDGHVIPGKVEPSHCVCYIVYEGRIVAIEEYEILVDPSHTNKSVNDYFVPKVYKAGSRVPYMYAYTH